jgi:hypothetical protein
MPNQAEIRALLQQGTHREVPHGDSGVDRIQRVECTAHHRSGMDLTIVSTVTLVLVP